MVPSRSAMSRLVGEFAGPERHVDVIFGQAEDRIGENEADNDVGIGPQELGQNRNEMQASEADGSRDDELAGRLHVLAGGGSVGLREIGDERLIRPRLRGSAVAVGYGPDPARR